MNTDTLSKNGIYLMVMPSLMFGLTLVMTKAYVDTCATLMSIDTNKTKPS